MERVARLSRFSLAAYGVGFKSDTVSDAHTLDVFALVGFEMRKLATDAASVEIGDDAIANSCGGVVHRQESAPMRDRTVICLPVVIVHFAPFAGLMPLNGEQDVVVRNVIEGVRRGDNPAESELGNGLCIRTHNR